VETRRARGDVDARGPSRRKVNIPTIPVFHIGVFDGWLARAEIGVALAGYLTLSVERRVYIRYPNQVTASI
jgi:hypothetical protein